MDRHCQYWLKKWCLEHQTWGRDHPEICWAKLDLVREPTADCQHHLQLGRWSQWSKKWETVLADHTRRSGEWIERYRKNEIDIVNYYNKPISQLIGNIFGIQSHETLTRSKKERGGKEKKTWIVVNNGEEKLIWQLTKWSQILFMATSRWRVGGPKSEPPSLPDRTDKLFNLPPRFHSFKILYVTTACYNMLQHIFICVLCITMINHGIHIMDKFPNTHASSDPEVMFQTALPDDGKEASPSATWVAGMATWRPAWMMDRTGAIHLLRLQWTSVAQFSTMPMYFQRNDNKCLYILSFSIYI